MSQAKKQHIKVKNNDKGQVRPILEYGSSVWDPQYEGLIDDLEKVRKTQLGL